MITTSFLLTKASIYLADVIAKKYIGNYFDDSLKKLFPKQVYQERLRIVIQKAADEFNKNRPSSKYELLSFTNSESLFPKLLEWKLYKDSVNPLTEESFNDIDNISQPDKDELDEFFELFIKYVEEDEKLSKLYIEENYKKAALESQEKLSTLNTNVEKLTKNTQVEPQIINDSILNDNPGFQFYYTQRITNFIGREKEIQTLKDFFFSSKTFTWWLLTGQGGTGKSRLALELCLELRQSLVNCGFVSFFQIRNINWNNWRPENPTLYIIDYVANDYEFVLGWLNFLTNRVDLRVPVRVLLIERESSGNWWKGFINNPIISSSIYNKSPINIEGLPIDKLVVIVKQVIDRANNNTSIDEKYLESVLIRFDIQQRPLFAMFIGIAFAYGQHIRDWNQHDLLDFYLDQEEKNINSFFSKFDEKTIYQHKNMLIIATMSYGITDKQLEDIFDRGISWLPNRENFNNELYKALSGNSKVEKPIGSLQLVYENGETDKISLSPLLPDILGEYFVLRNLTNDERYTYRDRDRLIETKKIAYDSLNGFITVNFFLRRILQDFTTHPLTLELIKQPYNNFIDNRGIISKYIVGLMETLFNDNKNVMQLLWGYTKELYEESKKFASEKSFQDSDRVYANATLFMVIVNKEDLQEQTKYYSILRTLSGKFFPVAVAAFGLNEESYNRSGSPEEAPEKMPEFEPDSDLAHEWIRKNIPIYDPIPHIEALALQDIITQLAIKNKHKLADLYFDRLYELSEYSDPRIKNVLLQTWIAFGEENIDSLDTKLNTLFDNILKTRRQIEPINVEHEQFIFLRTLLDYITGENDTATYNYFDTFYNHLIKKEVNERTVYTFVDTTYFAFQICSYYYEKDDLINGDLYYRLIFEIGKCFTKGIIPEILQIGWDVSQARLKFM